MDRERDDQPVYKTLKQRQESEQENHKKEMHIPFVPQEPKTQEYMAAQRNEFASLLTRPDVKLDNKATEFAIILLQGFNRN